LKKKTTVKAATKKQEVKEESVDAETKTSPDSTEDNKEV
jgi:hypothetical protein